MKPDAAPLRQRRHELAKDRPAFGVQRLPTRLRRDGLVIKLKTGRRLDLEEHRQRKPRRRRRRSSPVRLPRAEVGGPTARWAMDVMPDVLATGQHVRVLTLVDVSARECVALAVAKSFSGAEVARLLSDAGARAGGRPPIIQCANGPACTATALDHGAYAVPLAPRTARLQPAWQAGRQLGPRGVQRLAQQAPARSRLPGLPRTGDAPAVQSGPESL